MKSYLVVKKYSRPLVSPGRGGRVVVETDNSQPGWRAKKAFTRLDFPAPEGAAIISSRPLLKVLHLLTDLFNQELHLNRDAAKFR